MRTFVSRILVTLSLGAALGAGPLLAQGPAIRADIPFAFAAGAKWFPAGQYNVSADMVHGQVLVRISSADNRANLMMMSYPAAADNTTGRSKLVFNQYGNRYYLSQIWRPDDVVRELPRSKAEREQMASHASPARVAVVGTK